MLLSRNTSQFNLILSPSDISNFVSVPFRIIIVVDIHNKGWHRHIRPLHSPVDHLSLLVISNLIHKVEVIRSVALEVSVSVGLRFDVVLFVELVQLSRYSYPSDGVVEHIPIICKWRLIVIFAKDDASIP